MVSNYDALIRTIAEICNKIRDDVMTRPQDMLNGRDRNEGNLHEAMVIHHDALLAHKISNLPTDRKHAICVEAGLRYENTDAAPTLPIREDAARGLENLVLNSRSLPTKGLQKGMELVPRIRVSSYG